MMTRGGIGSLASGGHMLPLLALLLLAPKAWGLDLVVVGAVSWSIDASDLAGPPGSDLVADHETGQGDLSVDVLQTAGASWSFTVRRDALGLPTQTELWVRRSSAGGGGSVAGGTSYLRVTETEQVLFTGQGDVSGVDLQFKLTDVSLSIVPDLYLSNLTFGVSTS